MVTNNRKISLFVILLFVFNPVGSQENITNNDALMTKASGHDEHAHENEDVDHDEHAHEKEDVDHDEHAHEKEDVDHDEHAHEKEDADHDEHAHEKEDADHDEHAHEKEDVDHDEHDHEKEESGHDDHADEVHLRPEQIKTLEIKTQILEFRKIGEILHAPGEVSMNKYATSRVVPRVQSQVMERYARLGDKVKKGQVLVTLSSVEMAEAQGNVVVTGREWLRVKKLGRKVVSESRFLEAEIAHQQARAKAIAYGMTSSQVDHLLKSGAKKADGTFVLLSPRTGTVIQDEFIAGEVVDPGRMLFEITDETVPWVEAKYSPTDASRISVGNKVNIKAGNEWVKGKVIQIHHIVDEVTRTRSIRIEVSDTKHLLHSGEFVDVAIEAGHGKFALVLPDEAVLRSPDGDWQVFTVGDEPGAFKPVEVRRLHTRGGLTVIDGIDAGTEVVIHGAFFLASELAKGGFDPHNH